jgi:hypothetical protein
MLDYTSIYNHRKGGLLSLTPSYALVLFLSYR